LKIDPLVRQILAKLHNNNQIENSVYNSTVELIQAKRYSSTYNHLTQHLSLSYPLGWNKIWSGQTLSIWFGGFVFRHSLRLIALEIEAVPKLCAKLRNYLTGKFYENGNELEDKMENFLSMFGLASVGSKITQQQLLLLHRLNADQREQPLIERWQWSRESGIANLSDDGKEQVSLDLVWLRAVENALYQDYSHYDEIIDFISKINPDQSTIALQLDICEGVSECLNTLQLYGLGHKQGSTFQLRIPAGEFPAIFNSISKQNMPLCMDIDS